MTTTADSPQDGGSVSGPDWQWWSGPDDEFYRCGPHATREDAIEDARSNYDDRTYIYVIEAVPQMWPAPDAVRVIEDLFENSDDLFSEDYPDRCGTPDENKQAEQELQVALNAWMDKWRDKIFPTPTTFGCTRNAESIAIEPPVPESTS